MKGTIINIQHYAVQDGPGIRTLVFFKGCPLKCAWCCNPESQSPGSQLRYISYRCKQCMECVSACTNSGVSSEEGHMSHSFELCNECNSKICIDKCNYDAVALTGKDISSEELLASIAADISFYRNSGGGVTFSGGEPFAQHEFLVEMLQKCKALDIHTAIETCGWASEKALRKAIPYTDLFLFDLKIADPDLHLEFTRKPVGPILANLELLSSEKADIIIRFPVIAGITDSTNNLEGIAAIMYSNNLKQINLMPFHSLGTDKYEEHGMKYTLDQIKEFDPGQITAIRDFFLKQDFICEIS